MGKIKICSCFKQLSQLLLSLLVTCTLLQNNVLSKGILQKVTVLFVYICVAALGPPEFVSSDLESIAMTWNASKSSKFAVQLWNNKTRTWFTAHCKESMAADSCVKESPRATVVNLKSSTLYYFRIYVSRLSVSSPSEPMKTKNLGMSTGIKNHLQKFFIVIQNFWLSRKAAIFRN